MEEISWNLCRSIHIYLESSDRAHDQLNRPAVALYVSLSGTSNSLLLSGKRLPGNLLRMTIHYCQIPCMLYVFCISRDQNYTSCIFCLPTTWMSS
ncbi:hypothetical protein M5689_006543 [Euphorbia peplus]|nr:hypothetical protein M5689_006543 [Euphorbia peplus]